MKRIQVAGPAERDLDDIWFYIAKSSSSIEIANSVIDSITETFSLLARAPEAGSKRETLLREFEGFQWPGTSFTTRPPRTRDYFSDHPRHA